MQRWRPVCQSLFDFWTQAIRSAGLRPTGNRGRPGQDAGVDKLQAVADRGYYNCDEILKCEVSPL